jgi:hypothetical protein
MLLQLILCWHDVCAHDLVTTVGLPLDNVTPPSITEPAPSCQHRYKQVAHAPCLCIFVDCVDCEDPSAYLWRWCERWCDVCACEL